MTRGELSKIALALNKVAEVEETINNVEVWEHLGPDGIDNVYKLRLAINTLANVIADHTLDTRGTTK